MTCPVCKAHAALLTSSEYDDQHDDALSGDAAVNSRDTMIERCREAVHADAAPAAAPVVHLFPRSAGRMDRDPGRRRQTNLRDVTGMLAARLENLSDDIACGDDPDWSLSHMRMLIDDTRAAAGLPAWGWRGRMRRVPSCAGVASIAAE